MKESQGKSTLLNYKPTLIPWCQVTSLRTESSVYGAMLKDRSISPIYGYGVTERERGYFNSKCLNTCSRSANKKNRAALLRGGKGTSDAPGDCWLSQNRGRQCCSCTSENAIFYTQDYKPKHTSGTVPVSPNNQTHTILHAPRTVLQMGRNRTHQNSQREQTTVTLLNKGLGEWPSVRGTLTKDTIFQRQTVKGHQS